MGQKLVLFITLEHVAIYNKSYVEQKTDESVSI